MLGGFQTRGGQGREIRHWQAKWFRYELNRANAGWAFDKGEPYKTTASLELLATAPGEALLPDGDEDPEVRSGCSVSVGGRTDNRGNKFTVARLPTTKWPPPA